MRASFVLFEALWLTSSVGCQQPKRAEQQPRLSASASAFTALLVPRAASRFRVVNGKLRQEQPRLPDTGEWRCAEQGKVVWCAGGKAAAGIVSGPPDRGYRCGPRWGTTTGERVCVDEHPDYPGDAYRCAFEQERGMARVCETAAAWRGPALPPNAIPACWLDRDCFSQRCERGVCGCASARDCTRGRCAGSVCVEVKP
jgi:hypothetical protein